MIVALLCALLQSPGELQAGFGAVDITPEIGASIPGGWRAVPGRGVLDPLYAVACVISDGTTPVTAPPGLRTARTPTSGSIGPAGRTISA